MTNDPPAAPAPGRPRRTALTALAAGSLAGLVLGLGGVASAQDTATAPTPSTSAVPEAPATEDTTPEGDGPTRDALCDEEDGDAV